MLKKLVISLLCIIPITACMMPEDSSSYKQLSQPFRLDRLNKLSLNDRCAIMKLTSERRTILLFASIPFYAPEARIIFKSRVGAILPLLRKNNVLSEYEHIVFLDEFVQLGDDLELLHRQNK